MEQAEIQYYIEKLRPALGCPIKWEEHFRDEYLCKELRIYWKQTCKEFETYMESHYYCTLNINWGIDEGELSRTLINSARWRQDAVDKYFSKVGFLTKLSHLDQFGYPKHFPLPNSSKIQITERTRNSDSLFFLDVTNEVFQWLFECILTQGWLVIVTNRPQHIFLTSEMVVGASNGSPTNTLRFDMDYSTPTIHSHPRQPDEIPPGAIHFFDEDYKSGCYDEDEFFNELNYPDIDEWKSPVPTS